VSKFFIDRPIFAMVLAIIITLVGLISALNLPIAQYPEIAPPQVTVSTSYVGANAEVVEQAIAQVIENQVNGVDNMVSMSSTSTDTGSYSLNVQFQPGTNSDIDAVDTQNRVAQADPSLPQAVTQMGVVTQKVSPENALIFALYSPNKTYDSVFLKNYGDINLVDDLKRVSGVGNVNEYGSDFAMRVWLKPDKMAQLGITTSDIIQALNDQNVQAPAGTIGAQPSPANQQFQYTARVTGRLKTPAEFKKVILRANPDGTIVRLQDVADVALGGENYMFSTDMSGKPAAVFAVQLTPDANALQTVSACEKVIAEASKRFPADMKAKVVVDSTQFVRESMKEVLITFAEALILVLLVVFVFLQNWRATLIPMLAVPVSLIGTFGAFMVLGFSINTLTLFAMVLAIGLVVDDAIVVIEAVEYHMRYNGLTPHDATKRAMSEVSGPVVAIAFVLASVFIPVAFFGGTVGILYKQFALTIAVSMALSAIVALSLTPALCSLLLKPHDPEAHGGLLGRFFDRFNAWFESLVNGYTKGLIKVIRRATLCILTLGILVLLTMGLFTKVPTSFVPDEDQGYFISSINLPEAASMNRTYEAGSKFADAIRKLPGVQDTALVTGFDILSRAGKPNAAIVFTRLKPWAERTTPQLQVSQEIRKTFMIAAKMPELTALSFNAPSLPGIGTMGGFSLVLEDRGNTDIAEMERVSNAFVAAARKHPEIGFIRSSFNSNTPGYQYEIDRDKVKMLGIPLDDVFSALQVFLGGYQVNQFNTFGRTYKVVMQAEPQFRDNKNDIRYYFVRTASGKMVPLNTLLKPVQVNEPSVLQRYNGFPCIQINGSPAPGYSSGQTMKALEEVAAQTLPANFSYEWTDQSREESISGGKAPVLFGLALLFVFLCLAALYESWSVPFAVLLCVPTGVFGAFAFQYIRHLQNNIYMQIGLIMLIGLAAKNAILIVEFAKVRVDRGMSPAQAAIEAAGIRLRPILMTSLAFIIGCLPLAYATGAGAGARNAMGTAVVGGMFMATSLGIFLIPVLFVVVEKITERIRRLRHRGTQG
jgi:hydrophobe/amphiphile efflux-1 (HAE1) family protein